jgi:hypothetical protein
MLYYGANNFFIIKEVIMYAPINEAVDIRLISEVPLVAFLSGGVDSSAVMPR